jgi:uncharacterized repeat protein (TIGR01451 family)
MGYFNLTPKTRRGSGRASPVAGLRIPAGLVLSLFIVLLLLIGTATAHAVDILSGVPCPTNLGSCTANDVVTTVVNAVPVNGDECESPDDTITIDLTVNYKTTANQRYDLGVFLATDGGPVNWGTDCVGAAAAINGGDGVYPNVFLDLDPLGHSDTDPEPDTCGDLASFQNTSETVFGVDWTVRVTVQCVPDADNNLVIESCRVWEQNANHKSACTNLADAGTGSKCDCTPLTVTQIPVPFGATIEVVKATFPSDDSGQFNLQIDYVTEATGGNGATTDPVTVSAGTSADPGAIHTVGETAESPTVLSDYVSTITCTDGIDTIGPVSATSLDLTVNKDDAWVCTITNTIKPGTIIVDKVTDPVGDPTIFSFALTGGPGSVNVPFSLADGQTFPSDALTPGTYSVTETLDDEFDTTVVCLSSKGNAETHTAIELDADETVTCTFTNKIRVTGLNLSKTVTTENGSCPGVELLDVFPGQTVKYCYEVENTGFATALNVTLEDDNGTPGDTGDDFIVPLTGLTDGDLPVGDTAYGEALVIISSDVAVGTTVTNIATADAENALPATDDANVIVADVELEIVKTVVEAGDPCPVDPTPDSNEPQPQLGVASGDMVRYCYWIKNLGLVAAIDLTLTDDTVDLSGITLTGLTDIDGDGNDDDLDVEGIATAYVEVQVFGLIDSSIINTGTADALNADPDTDRAQVDFITTAATCSVLKTVLLEGSCPGAYEVVVRQGDDTLVTYCYELANGGFALTNVTFVDDQLGNLGAPSDLAAGGSYNTIRTATVNATIVNTATAMGYDPGGNPIDCSDFATVDAVNPDIEIIKTAMVAGGTCGSNDSDPLDVIGPTNVEYCYKVINQGDTEITTATVTDNNATSGDMSDDFEVGTVGPIPVGGESEYLTSGPEAITADRVNIGTVDGTDENGFGVTDDDPATVNYLYSDVAITKSGPDVIDTSTCGDPCQFAYTLTVTNLGNTTAVNVTVNDTAPNGIDFVPGSATTPQGSCTTTASQLVCNLGDLVNGGNVTIEITAQVEDGFVGFTTNEACVATTTYDSDSSNNCDDQTTRITAGATRTIGYWKTHPEALDYCLDFGPIELGFTTVEDVEEALAVLKSNIAQCPDDGGKRSSLGKAHLQAGRQVLALICNARVLGTSCGLDIDEFVDILAEDDAHAIIQVGSEADECNNSGSDIPDDVLAPFSPADPKYAFTPSEEGCGEEAVSPAPKKGKK